MQGNKRYMQKQLLPNYIIHKSYDPCKRHTMFPFICIDEYIKVYHSNCLSGQGFRTLEESKYACSSNKNCVGILDEGCKQDFEYYICLGFYSEDKEHSSCIYKKREAKGISYYNIMNNVVLIQYDIISRGI